MDDRRTLPDLPTREQGTLAPVAVAVAGRRRPILPGVLLATLALAVAVLKPWGGGADAPRPTVLVQAPPTATVAQASPGPGGTASSSTGDEPDITRMCLNTDAWLVASVEQELGGSVRVWRALDPGIGLRPDDPTVPRVFVGSQGVTALGWCAPVDGPERPSGGTTVEAWSVAGGIARPISLLRVRPTGDPSSLGALYRTTRSGTLIASSDPWLTGRYVFQVRSGDGPVQTFGVDIEIVPLGPPRAGVALGPAGVASGSTNGATPGFMNGVTPPGS